MTPDLMQVVNQIENENPEPMGMGLETPAMPMEQEDARLNPNELFIRVKLDEQKKRDLITFIKDEMTVIEGQYNEFGYFEKVQKSDDEFELVKAMNVNSPRGSNRKLSFLQMFTDVFTGAAKRQTDVASPMFLMELDSNKEEKGEDGKSLVINDITGKREQRLDFLCRKKSFLPQLHAEAAYPRGYWQGTAMIKAPFVHASKPIYDKTIYGPESVDKFQQKYASELLDPESKESKELAKLMAGGKVAKITESEKVTAHATIPYRTPLQKFFARLWTKDLNDCPLVAEQLDLNWVEVLANFNTGFYDEEELDEFKKRNDDYKRKQFNDIYEAIVQCDIEDEDVVRTYQIVFDSATEQILRVIRYPYKHGRCYYVPFSARPRDNSWLGYMAWERLEDTISASNAFLNSTINEFALAHHPVVLTNSAQDMGRVEIDADDDISVIRMGDASTTWQQLKFEYSPMDRANFLRQLEQLAELTDGVQASMASGGETPDDPRAPAAKTAMKMQATHMRMEDMILNLQRSDEELAFQIDSNDYQFPEYEGQEDRGFYGSSGWVGLKNDAYNYDVRYICHGSRMAFNKSADLQVAMATHQYIKAEYPELMQYPEIKKLLLEITLNNTQGSINQNKDRFLKPMDDIIQAKREAGQKMQGLEEQAAAAGIDVEAARRNPKAFIDQMRQRIPGQGGQSNGGSVPAVQR